MEITLPISSLLIISIGSLGVCISILISLVLFFRKKNHHVSYFLFSFLLFLSGLTLLNDTLTISGITNRYKQLYFIPIFYSLSIAPLFYLFVKSKFHKKLLKTDYLHLILPFIQALIYFFIGFQSIEFKSLLWNNAVFKNYLTFESIIFPIGLIFYSFLSRFLLLKASNYDYFWNNDLKKWLFSLANTFIFIAIVEFIISINEYFFEHQFGSTFFILRFVIFAIFILWIAFYVLQLLYPSSIYKTNPEKKPALLSKNELFLLKNELLSLMEKEKIYLNSDLTLSILSKYLNTSEKKCSFVLSHELNSNFNLFVNKYRVEEFKEKLRDGKHKTFTLLSLAYESGFDSKSTFNRLFKQLNGMTPSQFIKSL